MALDSPVTGTTSPLVAMGINHEDQTLDGRGRFVHAKELFVSTSSLKNLNLEKEQEEIKRKGKKDKDKYLQLSSS